MERELISMRFGSVTSSFQALLVIKSKRKTEKSKINFQKVSKICSEICSDPFFVSGLRSCNPCARLKVFKTIENFNKILLKFEINIFKTISLFQGNVHYPYFKPKTLTGLQRSINLGHHNFPKN